MLPTHAAHACNRSPQKSSTILPNCPPPPLIRAALLLHCIYTYAVSVRLHLVVACQGLAHDLSKPIMEALILHTYPQAQAVSRIHHSQVQVHIVSVMPATQQKYTFALTASASHAYLLSAVSFDRWSAG